MTIFHHKNKYIAHPRQCPFKYLGGDERIMRFTRATTVKGGDSYEDPNDIHHGFYKQGYKSRGRVVGPSFLPYLTDQRVLDVAEKWFGPHVRISFTNALVNSPGNERGGWHADWLYNQEKAGHIPAPYPGFPVQLSTLWMLSEFTADNRATWVIPGSHRTTDNPTGTMVVGRFESYPTEI